MIPSWTTTSRVTLLPESGKKLRRRTYNNLGQNVVFFFIFFYLRDHIVNDEKLYAENRTVRFHEKPMLSWICSDNKKNLG
jgi:hypothetical protein